MSLRRTLAISRRIAEQFRRDERTLALLFVAPIVILALLGWVIRDQAPPAGTRRDRQPGRAARPAGCRSAGDLDHALPA